MKKMLNFINEKIKDIDILGHPHTFKYQKRDIYSTTLGGIISLVAILVAWTIIGVFFYEFWDLSNPVVVESITKSTEYPPVDIYSSRFVPQFHLQRGDNMPIPFEEAKKYVTIVQSVFSYTGGIDSGSDLKIEFYDMDMELCINSDPWLNERYLEEGGFLTFFSKGYAFCSNPKN